MYIIREIFHLQFGRDREAKTLPDEGLQNICCSNRPGAGSLLTLPARVTGLSLNSLMQHWQIMKRTLQRNWVVQEGRTGLKNSNHWSGFPKGKY